MLRENSIGRGMKIRLVAFVLAIGVMVALIAWTAYTSWYRTGELREKFTTVQLKSFQIADHFQQTILELNNAILRYGVYHDARDWAHFDKTSDDLDKWIDIERPNLSSDNEKLVLDHINAAYDEYMLAGRQIKTNVQANLDRSTRLEDFASFEKQSQRILNLGFELARAHRESMDSFLAESKKSLTYLRYLLLISLTLLLLSSGGLAVVVYGELIAPLRIKLVESQALVDRQEKLASLGLLAAGVAHEIRNPLTAIKGWLFIQQKHTRPGTSEYEDAQIIANEISRLEGLVKEVLLFARPSDPHFVVAAIENSLREAQVLLTPQMERNNIRLSCENSVSANVRFDPQQIKQVLINLIQNAAESIGQDGEIVLRIREGTRRVGDADREVVILEVSDTGKGIPPDVEKRLFDPFFTTKEEGTGLGLCIAARIVEKHGGILQYQTQVNRGTTFGIVLPRV
jgi:signal transduction histidine kinase